MRRRLAFLSSTTTLKSPPSPSSASLSVQHFFDWVDSHEPFGVYTLRWGDAPLRFATVGLFGSDEGTLMLNLLYQHFGWFMEGAHPTSTHQLAALDVSEPVGLDERPLR